MKTINYPDVLGYITGGVRQSIGALHGAVAVRPHPVRAGRPFELVVLLQNAGNTPVDVSAAVRLPDQDAKRQKGRFATKTPHVTAQLLAGETGYIALPCMCHPETAPHDEYKLAVEIESKPHGKPERIRQADGGGAFDPDRLDAPKRAALDALKPLTFGVGRGGNRLELTFGVLNVGAGASGDLKPGWVSLCRLADFNDDRLLLHTYGKPLQVEALPTLKRTTLLKPLTQATAQRFGDAGNTLDEFEARAIAKLMMLILEYASPKFTGHGYQAAGRFAITPLLERSPLELDSPDLLPHWGRGLLRFIDRDSRAAAGAAQVVLRMLYDDLLRDAIEWGFELVEGATGIDIGSLEERAAYADSLLDALRAQSGVTFSQAYLPLVMGGILINDSLLIEREDPAELLKGVSHALEARLPDLDENDAPIQEITDLLLERTAQKYGYKLN